MGRKVIVYHCSYGCDSGCCGHVIEVDDKEVPGSFEFSHPCGDEEARIEWAKQFIRDHLSEEHVADLDWANCLLLED